VVVSPSARQDGEEASTVVMALFATVISVLVPVLHMGFNQTLGCKTTHFGGMTARPE
jgi:hypothetical protein